VLGIGLNATDTVLLVDEFPPHAGNVPFREEFISPGGQVASAVVACAHLGLRTRYIGVVGDDVLAYTATDDAHVDGDPVAGVAEALQVEELAHIAKDEREAMAEARVVRAGRVADQDDSAFGGTIGDEVGIGEEADGADASGLVHRAGRKGSRDAFDEQPCVRPALQLIGFGGRADVIDPRGAVAAGEGHDEAPVGEGLMGGVRRQRDAGDSAATARAAGETAPVLLVNSLFDPYSTQLNIFGHGVPAVPMLILNTTDLALPDAFNRAWGAAFVLLVLILFANILARVIVARSRRRMGL